MKILKYLLVLILFLIVVTMGTLFFSGKIIESKLNSNETQVENFKFSLGKREMTFDNISIDGNKMGPGKATISLKEFFKNIFDKEVYLNELQFTNTDFNTLFAAPDENIDRFLSKIKVPKEKKAEIGRDNIEEELAALEAGTDEMLNFNFLEKIEELEKIKKEFSETQDLEIKISKLKEISEKSEKIKKDIIDKKTLINEKISDLDSKNIKALNVYTDNLEELNNVIKGGNSENIKRITFIDKGQEILQDLNISLKTAKMVQVFTKNNIKARKIILIDKEKKIEFDNIGSLLKNITAVYKTKDAVYEVIKDKKSELYKIIVTRDKLSENIFYENGKITADVRYIKTDFLPGIPDIVIETKLLYNDDTLNINTNNSMTKEQEIFIKDSIEKIKQKKLTELSKKYNDENRKINNIQDKLYEKEKELDSRISKLKVLSTSSLNIN